MSYLYSRVVLVKLIRRSSRTKDGFFWCPFVRTLLMAEGEEDDSDYCFSRRVFEYKLYYGNLDIKMFLEKEDLEMDLSDYYRKHENFYNRNKDIINLDVNDYVKGNRFTVGELVDTYEFRY